jgi:di/tricarboxylate transporter
MGPRDSQNAAFAAYGEPRHHFLHASGAHLAGRGRPNALVYGTGHIATRSAINAGEGSELIAVVVVFGLLRLLCPLLGWA